MKINKNQKGITLIETTVSIALLSIVALMIITSVSSSGKAIVRGAQLNREAKYLEADIETELQSQSTQISEDSKSVSFALNGKNVTINGRYKTYTFDSEGSIGYTIYTKE